MPKPLVLFLLPTLAGCTAVPREVQRPEPIAGQRGVVFAVDGAGGFHATSASLRRALREQGAPLAVEEVDWSHGFGRVLADQIDQCHLQQEGRRLAVRVAAYRQLCPAGEVYLVGHSAGCAVALTAVECLAPGAVDRLVLLSPSVSAGYDLRPALRTCRRGVDVFYSTRDVGYLGLGVGIVGTADRQWTAPAGRVGFEPQAAAPEDMLLLAKLRQHPWHPCVAWSGNEGGHYGGYQITYLKAYVLPLLTASGP